MAWKFGKKLADAFGLTMEALDVISKLTASVSDDKAVDTLKAVASVVETLRAGFEGKISLEACEHALADLRSRLVDNDDVADAMLADKFPSS